MHLNKWQSLHFLGNVSTIRKQLIVSLGCIDQVVHHQKQVNGGYLGRVEPLEAPNLERRALRTSAASYITLSLHDHPPTILTACASFCDLDSLRQLLHCWSWWGGWLPKKRKRETLLLWLSSLSNGWDPQNSRALVDKTWATRGKAKRRGAQQRGGFITIVIITINITRDGHQQGFCNQVHPIRFWFRLQTINK